TFALGDLRAEFRQALSGLSPGQVSAVTRVGNNFFIFQLVAPEESEWKTENAAAVDHLQKGRYADATRSFLKAVQLAGKFGAADDRLGESLNGLAETYRQQEDFANAAAIYRRILAIRWSAPSNKGDIAVSDLLDRFADALSLAYFRGSQFEEAAKKYQ